MVDRATESSPDTRPRVLIVEDNTADVELLCAELRRGGLDVATECLQDEGELLEAIRTRPDLVLSDFNLPQLNAFRVLKLLADHGCDVPVIVVSGSISEEIAVECMKRGATDYIIKDRLTRLAPAVAAAIEQHRLRRERRKTQDDLIRSAREQQRLLRELEHRVSNNLSSVLSLIELMRSGTADVNEFASIIAGRVRVMSTVHSLVSRGRRSSVDLHALAQALVPPERMPQVSLRITPLLIGADQATAAGIVLHELFANSVRYGALSTPDGRVSIESTLVDESAETLTLRLEWLERDGPPIASPPTPRLGTTLVTGLVRSDLRGTVDFSYPAQGARHVVTCTIARSE